MTWSRPPHSRQEERSLLVPRSWTYGLQNCKTVFLLFKLCNLWYLIMDCCLVAQLCLTLFDPMDCNMPGFPVHHHFLELAQTHVHWVRDAIQPSHPLSSPSPPAFNLSQHQGLFQLVSSSHQVAKVLEFQLQRQSFQWIFRTDFLSDGLVWSPCSPRDSQESSPATLMFKSINYLALSFFHGATLTSKHDYWKNHSFDYCAVKSNVSAFYYAL